MLGLPPLPRTLEAALRDITHERVGVRRSALYDLVRLAAGPARPRAVAALARTLLGDSSAGDPHGCRDRARRRQGARSTRRAPRRARGRARRRRGASRSRARRDRGAGRRGRARRAPSAPRARARVAALPNADCVRPARRRRSRGAPSSSRATTKTTKCERWRFVSRGSASKIVTRRQRSSPLQGAPSRVPPSSARATAALFLAAHGERSAERALVDVLEGTTRASEADVFAAIETAAELGLEAARPALARRAFGLLGARSDTLGWQSCIALARFGDERAKQAIVRRLSAWNRDSRTRRGRGGRGGASRERAPGAPRVSRGPVACRSRNRRGSAFPARTGRVASRP